MVLSLWKTLSVFSTLLVLILFFGGSLIDIGKAVTTGNWSNALAESGGKIFALDASLVEESNYLLNESMSPTTPAPINVLFHIIYSLSIVFMFFFIGVVLFKVGKWLAGERGRNPLFDVLLIVIVIAAFFAIEFLYTLLILKQTVYPLQGPISLLKALPTVIQNLFH